MLAGISSRARSRAVAIFSLLAVGLLGIAGITVSSAPAQAGPNDTGTIVINYSVVPYSPDSVVTEQAYTLDIGPRTSEGYYDMNGEEYTATATVGTETVTTSVQDVEPGWYGYSSAVVAIDPVTYSIFARWTCTGSDGTVYDDSTQPWAFEVQAGEVVTCDAQYAYGLNQESVTTAPYAPPAPTCVDGELTLPDSEEATYTWDAERRRLIADPGTAEQGNVTLPVRLVSGNGWLEDEAFPYYRLYYPAGENCQAPTSDVTITKSVLNTDPAAATPTASYQFQLVDLNNGGDVYQLNVTAGEGDGEGTIADLPLGTYLFQEGVTANTELTQVQCSTEARPELITQRADGEYVLTLDVEDAVACSVQNTYTAPVVVEPVTLPRPCLRCRPTHPRQLRRGDL